MYGMRQKRYEVNLAIRVEYSKKFRLFGDKDEFSQMMKEGEWQAPFSRTGHVA